MKITFLITALCGLFFPLFSQGLSIEERKNQEGVIDALTIDTTVLNLTDSMYYRQIAIYVEIENDQGQKDTLPPYSDYLKLGTAEQAAQYYFEEGRSIATRMARGLHLANKLNQVKSILSDYNTRMSNLSQDGYFKDVRDRRSGDFQNWIWRFREVSSGDIRFFRVQGNALNLIEVISGTWVDRVDGNEITGGKFRPFSQRGLQITNVYTENIFVVPDGNDLQSRPKWANYDLSGDGGLSYVITRWIAE